MNEHEYSAQGSVLNRKAFQTRHDEWTGTWKIQYKTRYGGDVKVNQTYKTGRINAFHIIERTLNIKSVTVTDEIKCKTNSSGKKRVINQPETVLALEKQKKIIEAFRAWIWKDTTRKDRLLSIYNHNFGCLRKRVLTVHF